MATLTRQEREEIARRRIVNILKAQGVANMRTLEQKIADAGPNPQRIQPHILSPVKTSMVRQGRLVQVEREGAQWLHLSDENPTRVGQRMAELQTLWGEFQQCNRRTGQALEIATYRALVASPAVIPLGGFRDLDAHDDGAKLYSKEELQNFNGKSLGKKSLDFIAAAGGDHCGIEVKNVRPWYYPHDPDLREAIAKARTLDVVPVVIARRIQFATFRVLGTCGVIMHETFNQRMATADTVVAQKAQHKDLLGYHDIRIGNLPDDRLSRFIGSHLPGLMADAREKLHTFGDLLDAYAFGNMAYEEFAARVRRRQRGQDEDRDPMEEAEAYDPYDD